MNRGVLCPVNIFREVGHLHVGDEIITKSDLPVIVEGFGFSDSDPGFVEIRTTGGSIYSRSTDFFLVIGERR